MEIKEPLKDCLSLEQCNDFIYKDCLRIRDRLNYASQREHQIEVQMSLDLSLKSFKSHYSNLCIKLQAKRRLLERKLKLKLICKEVVCKIHSFLGMKGPHVILTAHFYEISNKRPFKRLSSPNDR